MNKKHAILLQLFARVWPLLLVLSLIYLEVFTDTTWRGYDPYEFNWPWLIFVILVIPYCALVYYFLPTLIFPSINENRLNQFLFYIFTTLTAGVGPVIVYWVKVDKGFTDYIRNSTIE